MSGPDPYDTIPYEDRPVAETHPDRLYVAARLAGVAAAHPESARILELGCAHAVNLMPIAAFLPGARVLGIDRSARQIEVATARLREAGVTNLELRCADVMTLDLEGERFDYVIAHGLFSWVPDPVRDRVLALCREVLAENGIAYISYNTMPAWGIRGGVRRMLLELVGPTGDPREQIARARDALSWLAASAGDESAEGVLLREEIESLRERPDAYLLHEYLLPHARAYWFRQFADLLATADLSYVTDVAPTGSSAAETRAVRERARLRIGDPIAAEQLLDVMLYRQFRASIICRADALRQEFPAEALTRTLQAAARPIDTRASGPWDSILEPVRAGWPGDLPVASLAATASELLDAHAEGLVELRPRPLPIPQAIPDRPRVAEVTRFEARRFPFVTTLLHECAPLDPFHAALVARLDGTRPRAELADAILDDIAAGRLGVEGAPPITALRQAMPALVEAGLRRIHDGALLIE